MDALSVAWLSAKSDSRVEWLDVLWGRDLGRRVVWLQYYIPYYSSVLVLGLE
jgi:hypothetical protein